MKKTIMLLIAALLFIQMACAEPSVAVEGTDGAAAVPCDVPDSAEPPTVEALAEGYFGVLSRLEFGTAGISLKIAVAASEVCSFAVDHDLYNPDVAPLRANMLAAFEGMSEDEQAAFWEGFDAVRGLLDDCLEDYDANRAVFEDAGVIDAMDTVMYDPLNRLAWENLRDHTVSMENEIAG